MNRAALHALAVLLLALPWPAAAQELSAPIGANGPVVVVGAGAGSGTVRVLQATDGSAVFAGLPFGPAFTGGVRVAAGDVNGDGITDVITGAGVGGGEVRVFDGATFEPLLTVVPFGPGFAGGVFVAAGDIDGDGRADVIAGAGLGGGLVRVVNGAGGEIASGFPFTAAFGGGVRVAAGDINGDGRADVVAGMASAGGLVSVFSGRDASLITSGFPFGLFAGGVNVATGDVNGDGRTDVVVAPATGNGAVRAYSGLDVSVLVNVSPFAAADGITVATRDVDGDGQADIITAPGGGAPPLVRVLSGATQQPLASFFAFDPGFTGGVFVTAAGTTPAPQAPTPVPGPGPGPGPGPAPGSSGVAPTITSGTSTEFNVGAAGTFTVTTTGGPAPVITRSGALPAGVNWNDNGDGTATLSGTASPGSAGSYPFTITANNGVGAPAVQNFTLAVNGNSTPIFTSPAATTFYVGTGSGFTIQTSALPEVTQITLVGALPAGVTLVDNGNGTATLSGIPAVGTEATYALSFQATNGAASADQSFTLTVMAIPSGSPVFTSGDSTTFVVGTAGSFTVAVNSATPATLTLNSGTLPDGLTFVDNGNGTATLSGTPSADTAGTTALQFRATDGSGATDQLFSLTIAQASAVPVFTSGASTAFTIGTAGTFAVTTAATPTATVLLSSGVPPTGVNFTPSAGGGTLAGMPAAGTAGVYTLTFTASNGGAPRTQTFVLTIQEVAVVTSPNQTTFIVSQAGTFTFTASGAPTPTIQVTGTLPTGITNDPQPDGSSVLSGTPAAGTAGTYPLTVTPVNGLSGATPQSFTLSVVSTIPPTLDAISDPAAILEDAGQQTVNLTGITAGAGETQPLQVTASSSNTSLIPNPTVTYTSPNTTGSLAYTPVADAFGSAVITVTVRDGGLNNTLGDSDDGTFSRTFTVVVNNVNDATPTLDAIADQTVLEDAALTVNLAGISAGPGDTGQPLQVTASSNPPLLIPNPSVTYSSPNATGSLSITPVANAGGSSATITVTVTDGGPDNTLGTAGDNGTFVRTFTITVTAVNDAPSFTKGLDQSVSEDSGAQTVMGWAGAISPGPIDEASQTVTLVVTGNTNPGLFSAGPAISSAGVLTYTPTANASGTATITLLAMDNGGTANGGVDVSPSQNFVITITAVNDSPILTPGGASPTFTEDGAAVVLDPDLTVADPDSGTLASATVQITGNFQTAEDVLAFTNDGTTMGNITAAYNSATGTLTLTSAGAIATIQQWQGALRAVTYTNTSQNPATTSRTVGFTANDGVTNGNTTNKTLAIVAVNDAPVLTASGGFPYTENDPATAIAPALTVTDVDSTTLSAATISVIANFQSGQDVLSFTNDGATMGNIAVGSNAGGVLTLGSAGNTATVAEWQSALRAVRYRNSSEDPNTSVRIVSFVVNDGGAANNLSNMVMRTIGVTAVNDPPTANAFTNLPAQAGIPIAYPAAKLGGTDVEAGTTITIDTTPINVSGGSVVLSANGSFVFTPLPNTAGGAASFQYRVSDNGNPGPGANSAYVTVSFAVAGPAIYFVKTAAVGLGNCTLGNECTIATALTTVGATTNTRIFLGDNGSYSSNAVTLNTNGWLIGQGVSGTIFDTLFGIGVPAQGTLVPRPSLGQARPTVARATGTAITLGSGNAVRGLNVTNSNGSGITGAAVGTLTLSDFDITVTSGTALSLTTSGTVTATGTDNDLNSTNGTALNVNVVTISASGLTFKSIAAGAGANNGINLVSTGAGGLTVTGLDGPDPGSDPDPGSGGTITGKTGADGSTTAGTGIFLSNANNISLNGMTITNHQNYGIRGKEVDGFRMTFCLVGGANGTNVASPFSEGSVSFIGSATTGYGLRGTVAFLDNEITGGAQRNVSIDNATGTMNFNFLRNNVHDTSAVLAGDDGLAIELDTTSVMFANISNNRFTAHGGDHFNLSLLNSANADLTFKNNDMQGGYSGFGIGTQGVFILGASYNGTFKYDISNNGTAADPFIGNKQGGAIFVNKGSGTATFSGQITNNVIGNPAVTGSGSEQAVGIHASARGAGGSHTTLITGNAVRQYFDRGIVLEAGEGSPTLVATVTNNSVSNFADAVNSLHGIHFDLGILGADNAQITIDVRNNLIAAAGNEAAGGADFRMRTAAFNDTFIAGYSGGDSSANAQSFIDGQNLDGTTFTVTKAAQGSYNNGPASPLPTPGLPTLPPSP